MSKLAKIAAAAGALAAAGVTCAAHSETLGDAIAAAYASNPNLRAAQALQKQVDENYVQTRAQYGVTAQATVAGSYQSIRGDYFHGQLAGPSYTTNLQLSQPLYTGGRLHAALDLAEANIFGQRETMRQTEIQVLQQVISAYVAVRRDLQIVQVYQDNVQALQRQLDQVRAQFAVRQVTQTDIDQTRGRLALVQANVANAQAQLEISRSQYLQVVGQNPGELAPEPVLEIFGDIDQAFDGAELNNPSLNAARYQEQAARARVAQANANFLPNVSAQVGISQSPIAAYSPSLGDQIAVTSSVQASVPLYTSGLYSSSVRQAKAQVEQARAQIEVARRIAVQSVSQTWSQLVAARNALAADEVATTATQAAFYGVRREQPFDLRQPIDVLNAEQEFNNAQVRVLQDRYSEYVSRVNVLAAAGVLTPTLLSPETAPYRPETYFNKVRNRFAPPYIDGLKALDSLGIPSPPPPAIALTGPEGRTALEPALPAAPPAAATLPPFRTATSIMEADTPESGKAAARQTAPAGRCWDIGGRKIGDCLPPGISSTPTPPKP